MEHSDTLDEFAADFAAAQCKVESARKDSTNPHFRSGYASMAAVTEACRIFAEHGIGYSQHIENGDGDSICCTTFLMHKSGQWMRSTLCMVPGKMDAQGVGSLTTYQRRYCLMAAFGIAPADDDGNAAVGGMGRAVQQAEPQVAKWRTDAIALNASMDACETFEDLRAVMDTAESTGVMAEIGKHSPKTRDKLNDQYDRLNAALPAAETE